MTERSEGTSTTGFVEAPCAETLVGGPRHGLDRFRRATVGAHR